MSELLRRFASRSAEIETSAEMAKAGLTAFLKSATYENPFAVPLVQLNPSR